MKKALVVLLILAVAGGLFAQEWTFTGYTGGGIGIFIPDGEEGARAKLVSRDAGTAGNRVQFAGAYTSEAKNYGFSFRLRSENAGAPSLNYGYGWLSGLNGIVTGYAGKIDNDLAGVNTGDLIFDGRGGEGTGLYTVIKPISVLSVGFGVFGSTTPADEVKPEDLKYIGGVGVTIPGTVKVVVNFRNANKVSAAGTNDFEAPTGIGNDAQLAVGTNLLMVKGLKVSVLGVFNRLEDFSDSGVVRIFETASYTGITNLTIGLGLWQALLTGSATKDAYKKDMNGDDPILSFRGWVYASYGLLGGKIVPRLDVNYLMGGIWGNEYQIHFDDQFLPNFDPDAVLFSIRPSVGFQVTGNAWLEVGYIINKHLGMRSFSYATFPSGNKMLGALNQAIYADIKVTW
jgi:hypothetical protein